MARMTRLVLVSLVVVGMLAVPKTLTHPAHGQTGCGANTVAGAYGVHGWGFLAGAPASFVGTWLFDGNGASKASITFNVDGGIDRLTDITGSYKFDGDCTGTGVIKTVHHRPPVSHYHDVDMVVVDGGKQILFQVGSPKDSESGSPPPGEDLSGTMQRL